MAMQRQLLSVNSIAVELQRDRRTVARALDGVPADGMRGNHRAWYLTTAIQALRSAEPRQHVSDRNSGGLLNLFLSRLEDWEELRSTKRRANLDIRSVAAAVGTNVETILTWLRVGAPYVKEGCRQTGDGFVLRPSWIIDWFLMASALAGSTKIQAARALRLHIGERT